MSTLDELRRLLGYRPPLRRRPRCQHVSFDRRPCRRPAEYECDTGGSHRPRYVCRTCLAYQVACVGRIELAHEFDPVRITAEGGIVPAGRRTRK